MCETRTKKTEDERDEARSRKLSTVFPRRECMYVRIAHCEKLEEKWNGGAFLSFSHRSRGNSALLANGVNYVIKKCTEPLRTYVPSYQLQMTRRKCTPDSAFGGKFLRSNRIRIKFYRYSTHLSYFA